MITSTPIVGAHFRPPAKQVCALLSNDHPLRFEREPTSPYDDNAVKVLVDLTDMNEEEFWENLKPHLDGAGVSRDEVEVPDFHLGYVDSKKTGNAQAVCEAMQAGYEPSATLTRDMAGAPFAKVEWS